MPKFRTAMYAIWKACERFGMLPPDIKPTWDDNHVVAKANLLAYSQIREIEDAESNQSLFKGLF